MCGLKLVLVVILRRLARVTPFVGVWIETTPPPSGKSWLDVTPFVGVWIETRTFSTLITSILVTPFVGVWIETVDDKNNPLRTSSHPSWVCGLKHKAGSF